MAGRLGGALLKALVELPAVKQACQRVVRGLVMDVRLQAAHFRNIAHKSDGCAVAGIAVAQRNIDRHGGAVGAR